MKTQTIDPSLTRRVWRKLLSGSGDRPTIGSIIQIQPNELIRDRDGRKLAEGWTGHLVYAEIVSIGAHWSDQPHGQSGWHCELEFECPEYLAAKELA